MQKENGTGRHETFEARVATKMKQVNPVAESVADFKVDELRKIAALMGLKFDAERLGRTAEQTGQFS